MIEINGAKAQEMRALAKSFIDMAESTGLAEYKQKLLLAAMSLCEAASALEDAVSTSVC